MVRDRQEYEITPNITLAISREGSDPGVEGAHSGVVEEEEQSRLWLSSDLVELVGTCVPSFP